MFRKLFLLLFAVCLWVQTALAQSWEDVRAAYDRTIEKYSSFQCDLSRRTLTASPARTDGSDVSGQEKREEGHLLYLNSQLCFRHSRLVTLPKQSTFKTDQSFNGEYYIEVQEVNSPRQSVSADIVSRNSFDAVLSQVYLAVPLGYFPDPRAGSASIGGILNSMKIALSQPDEAGDWIVIGAIEPNYKLAFRFSKQHDWSISKLEFTNESELVQHFDIKSYRYEVPQFQLVDGTLSPVRLAPIARAARTYCPCGSHLLPVRLAPIACAARTPKSIKIEMTRHLVTTTQAPRPLTIADIQKLQSTAPQFYKPTGHRTFLYEFEITKPSFAPTLTKADFDIPIPDNTPVNVRSTLLTPHIYRAGRIVPVATQ